MAMYLTLGRAMAYTLILPRTSRHALLSQDGKGMYVSTFVIHVISSDPSSASVTPGNRRTTNSHYTVYTSCVIGWCVHCQYPYCRYDLKSFYFQRGRESQALAQ